MKENPMADPRELARLAPGPDRLHWARRRWPEFAGRDYNGGSMALLPVNCLNALAEDLPLDTEEKISGALLEAALSDWPEEGGLRILPPFRFGFRGSAGHFFGMDPEAVHAQLESIAGSVRGSGFAKLVLFNADAWNEPLVDAAARENRIRWGLQTFCINLSGLGLSFEGSEAGESTLDWVRAFFGGESGIIEEAGLQLRSLLDEIRARPLLPGGGAIPRKERRGS